MTIRGVEPLAFGLATQATVLTVLCALVLGAILVAGLWPFHTPENEVSWLSHGNGLLFGDYGSILSAKAFNANRSKADNSCSVEIWLEPSRVDSSGAILSFYRPGSRVVPLELRQSLSDLLIQSTSVDQSNHVRRSRIYVDNVFSPQKPFFFTITSGESGTIVYTDGTFVKKADFKLSTQELTGQLIVGNAPETTDNWSGQLKGLAIYDRELTSVEASQQYATWAKGKPTDLAKSGSAVALYDFSEGGGNIIHNQVDSATDLLIPKRFFVLHEQFLEPFWEEFSGGWSYWRNVGINIAGFIPLGFFFCAYFSTVRRIERPAAVTIALGLAVSLTIEVLQAFLPTRDSGTTDLITNTLGTAVGVMVYRQKAAQVVLATVGLHARNPSVVAASESKVYSSPRRVVHESVVKNELGVEHPNL
jgi:VanZ like family/Concanavalin A-like lectin/glucanases superfamily